MNVIVELDSDDSKLYSPDSIKMRRWVEAGLQACLTNKAASLDSNANYSVSIRIVSEAESASLNEQFRDKHSATNVLSFPVEIPAVVMKQLEDQPLGDIVICSAVVEQEANAQNKTLNEHWAHLIIHGVLHLIGYDHITAELAEVMESFEIKALETLGISNPYLIG